MSPNQKKSKPESYGHWLGRLGILAIGLAFCALMGVLIIAGEIYDYQDSVDGTHLPDVDAIVCLAGGRGRIAAAGDLWYRYWELAHEVNPRVSKVPTLYFSGLGRQASWPVLSRQLRRGVLQVIQPQNVIIENESSNTDTNARWLAHYARQRHWRKILLLTSSYHMRRARFIFDHVLRIQENPIDVETISVYQEPFAPEEWRTDLNGVRVTLVEYVKWVYYNSVLYQF
jgi:uncharacterized SAM-binding protein YcdF (DUF218 family)